MKTPKKVIEKISLPLMFITFVMAVIMFAVSPVSAAPDCENPKHQDKPACTGGDGEGSITYTAQLTGAFVFVPDPSVAVYPNSKESSLLGDTPLNLSIQLSDDEVTTWDKVFNTCPVLLAPSSVDNFKADDWYISMYGGVRIMFRDFLLPYDHEDGSVFEGAVITVQLIGKVFEFDDVKFLPVPGLKDEDEEMSSFPLEQFVIWGETAHGVPGPRRACQPPGGGGGGGETGDLTPIPSTLVITATRHIP